MKSKCKKCGELKTKEFKCFRDAYKKGYPNAKKKYYISDCGREWHGLVCPDCRHGKIIEAKCPECKTKFNKNENAPHTYCSRACFQKKNYRILKKKPKPKRTCPVCKTAKLKKGFRYCSDKCKPRKVARSSIKSSTCLQCANTFTGTRNNQSYCSKSCSVRAWRSRTAYKSKKSKPPKTEQYLAAKKANRLFRKAKKRQATPKWIKPKDFHKIILKCPEGFHLDHIVPLIHPDVCGLHVPWNIQYLSEEDNIKKSNKFDGTMDNTEWSENS